MLPLKVDKVWRCEARWSSTLAFDLHGCNSVVPDVPWRPFRWSWRDVGRPRPPLSSSTDPDKPSARPCDQVDPASSIHSIHHYSSSRCCLIGLPAGRRGRRLRGKPASWSRLFDTRPAERSSLPPREQSSRRRSSWSSSSGTPAAVAATGGGAFSTGAWLGCPAVSGDSDVWGTGCRGRYHRGTSVGLGCSTSDCDIRRSRQSAVSRLWTRRSNHGRSLPTPAR